MTSLPPAPKKARRSEISRQLNESVYCEDDDDDSPYTMYFVRIPAIEVDHPTKEEDTVHAELFRTLVDAGINPQWIDADAIFNLPQKDDFFIVPMFRGAIFRKLANEGFRVFGPPIVAECVELPKPLPLWDHPVYSSVFEGAKVTCTGFVPEKKREIHEKIGWMSGVISGNFFETMTHVIAAKADTSSEKYKAAIRSNLKLMRKEWVDEIWEKTQMKLGKFSAIDDDVVNSYKLGIFEGMHITLTKIEGIDRINLAKLIEENGGTVSGSMNRKTCTHLVTDQMSGEKYKKATEWGSVRIVQQRWVRKCVETGGVVDESKYHPKHLTATTAVEHFRSSTPQKESSPAVPMQSDISSISGAGGRLNCSLNSSNVSFNQVPRVFERGVNSSVSHVSNSVIDPPTPQTRIRQTLSTTFIDPIDDLYLNSNEDSDLFEGLMIWLCGVDASKMDKWRRLLDRSGATRVPKIESATHVVVLSPNVSEKATIRRYSTRQDISIVTAKWIVECFKTKELVPEKEFEWDENNLDDTLLQQATARLSRTPSTVTIATSLTTCVEEPPTKMKGVFAPLRFCVHECAPKNIIGTYREIIRKNGGIITEKPEDADYVVFGHSAPINTLLKFDAVVTYLYIDTCIKKEKLLEVSSHPLFVPLPQAITPVFSGINVILYIKDEFVKGYVKDLIEVNGGSVHEMSNKQAQETSYCIMMEPHDMARVNKNQKSKMCDLSWVISRITSSRQLPPTDYLFQGVPLDGFERNDDTWVKCTNEKENMTAVIQQEDENEKYEQLDDGEAGPSDDANEKTMEYKTDLTKPYKMRLKNMDSINKIIDAIPSPSRVDSEESMSTSLIVRNLKKAVENTGRRNVVEKRKAEAPAAVQQFEITKRFVLSCSEMTSEARDELKSIIGSLDGLIDENFTFQTTHMICPKLIRTPKALCTIAAGKWCLQPQYLYDSKRAGKWLDEREYEWTVEKLSSKAHDIEVKMARRCRYWREKIEQMPITMSVRMESRQNGAFSEWKCVIHSEDKRSLTFLPILEAGGAKVCTVVEYTEIVPLNPTHVFAYKDFAWNAQSLAMLRRESIKLLVFDYIYEFLIDENVDFSKYLKKS